MTIAPETVLADDAVQQLIAAAEQSGVVRVSELSELIEAHELDALEVDMLHHELESRGIELLDGAPEPEPAVQLTPETTTDALQLFLREAGRHALLTAAPGGRALQARRAR